MLAQGQIQFVTAFLVSCGTLLQFLDINRHTYQSLAGLGILDDARNPSFLLCQHIECQ